MAIALAMTSPTSNKPLHVITDCQQACRNYGNGRISTSALRLLKKHKDTLNPTILIWTPGHAGLDGNERAHATARACTLQAPHQSLRDPEPVQQQYRALLQHHRLARCAYPPPHQKLTREEAVAWRQLQTNTYPHLSFLHIIHPTIYPPTCPHCSEHPTLYHTTWACQNTPAAPIIRTPTLEQWEAALCSSDPEDQRQLVDRARRTAAAAGALD